MPKQPVDYSKGKIYRIICNKTNQIYIGSTCSTLTKRLSQHKTDFNCWLNGTTKKYVTSYKIIKNENYVIILIEEYPCENKNQLTSRERYYIELMDCVNRYIPTRTPAEYYQQHKERAKVLRKIRYEKQKLSKSVTVSQ